MSNMTKSWLISEHTWGGNWARVVHFQLKCVQFPVFQLKCVCKPIPYLLLHARCRQISGGDGRDIKCWCSTWCSDLILTFACIKDDNSTPCSKCNARIRAFWQSWQLRQFCLSRLSALQGALKQWNEGSCKFNFLGKVSDSMWLLINHILHIYGHWNSNQRKKKLSSFAFV